MPDALLTKLLVYENRVKVHTVGWQPVVAFGYTPPGVLYVVE